jgi:hypothetical protein
MKKLICILAGAALLTACGDKTEVAAPTPAPENKVDMSKMGARPKKTKIDPATTTLSSAPADDKVVPAAGTEAAATNGAQEAAMAASPTP